MWLMPSHRRPDALRRLLEAPGGWPSTVVVIVNADDPELDRYKQVLDCLRGDDAMAVPWHLYIAPPDSRFCEAVRAAFAVVSANDFFGIIDDDYWPVTPGWHDKLVAAAGRTGVAIANNLQNFPQPYCCRVMGGDLARAIGTIAPGGMRHNFSDDAWKRFADDFGLYRPLEDVIVEHRHHLFDKKVPKDLTYSRGSSDIEEDRSRYIAWLNSAERLDQCKRVAALLGVKIAATDFSKIRVGICVPIQNSSVDLAFHTSFHHTIKMCFDKGINVSIFHQLGGSHIGKAREAALWRAYYSEPQCTHFLFIDDDMGWQANLVSRLLCTDHDFCAASGVKKVDKLSLCFNPLVGKTVTMHQTTGFIGVRHVGFAFVMLKRAVIDRMVAAYPELRYRTAGKPESALFLDMITDDKEPDFANERLSEDLSFCQRWRDMGGEIWVDPDAALIHAGRKEYTGKPRDVMEKNP